MAQNPANFPLLDDFASGLAAEWSPNEIDTDSGGVLTVTGGAAGGTANRTGYWGSSFAAPMGARAKLSVLPSGVFGLWLVKTGNTANPDGYRMRYDPAGTLDFQTLRVNAGANTFIGGDDIADKPISAGDEIAIGIEGAVITTWVFHGGVWVVIDSDTDGAPLTGPFAPGIEINDATVRVDSFYGGQESVAVSRIPLITSVGAGG
jgi:hypothetical protein